MLANFLSAGLPFNSALNKNRQILVLDLPLFTEPVSAGNLSRRTVRQLPNFLIAPINASAPISLSYDFYDDDYLCEP